MGNAASQRKGLMELAASAKAARAGNRKKAAALHAAGDRDLGIYGHYDVKNPKSHRVKLEHS